jgi:hypothetical protein
MGLLQLLSVNQSVVNVKDAPSAYRLTKQNWLPQFGSEVDLALSNATTWPQSSEARTAPLQSNTPGPTRRLFRSSIKANLHPQQTELALEAAPVVCNDLSDSDFEVVRQSRKTPRPSGQAPAIVVAAASTSAHAGWSWWTKRFFGVSH